ncbi:MAG TPA: AmmeMemoRadiSam system protein B [Acidimicrobiales bacterium]|nr:AmmeMemoRadiSam system protein B [Acidimicrobiales bacterium]
MSVRPPAVAGSFYPADPAVLRSAVDDALAAAADRVPAGPVPKALIAPHAGYVYSAPIAASAYARVLAGRGGINRVVLVGPAHRVAVRGIAAPGTDAFATPLGLVPVDTAGRDALVAAGLVVVRDDVHAAEHSLEVQLPFLQVCLGDVAVLPLAVGDADPALVADVLDAAWGGDETLVVISSDLSHYLDHASAVEVDRRTAAAIVARQPERLGRDDACGVRPVQGLLTAADRHGLGVDLLDLRTSADTAGEPDRVVGYGAFALA